MRCPPTLIPRNRATYLIVSRLVIGPSSLVVGRWSLERLSDFSFSVFRFRIYQLPTIHQTPRLRAQTARLLASSPARLLYTQLCGPCTGRSHAVHKALPRVSVARARSR